MKRLGLDIGTNSIGWALCETKNKQVTEVLDVGVRIFSNGRDPQSGSSLAVDRRLARSMRRRRDRYLRRRTALMRKMADAGLMPANPAEAKKLEKLDPYELRAAGLDRKLPMTHLGRALFHLSQRRGFKSNRKTDHGDNEGTKIKAASRNLDDAMRDKDARTLGEFLHKRRASANSARLIPSVRTRLGVIGHDEKGKEKTGYEFYPERHHLEREFDTLWKAQAKHHPELTDGLCAAVREIIFYQRALRPQKVGKCRYNDEPRLAKAHPLTQRRVLFETVNNLRIVAAGKKKRPLTLDQRDKIIHALDNKKPPAKAPAKPWTINFKLAALAKHLKLARGEHFSLESIHRDNIACDPVRASLSHPKRFGPNWSTLDIDAQWEVVRRIGKVESEDDYNELVEWLELHHGLASDNAREAAQAPLPPGYGALGETATRQILEKLQEKAIPYSEAVEACGMHHSVNRTGEILDALPYYGEILDRHVIPGTGDKEDDDIKRYGRITNPTVHIGLNQLRRLVNTIIETHGVPDEMVVELARDLKQSDKQKEATQKTIRDNTKAAQQRSEKLGDLKQRDTGYNRALLRLFEDLNPHDAMKRYCPYSGQRICITMLFDGSCDVDHILPYSRTLDDGFANRTLCLKKMNREKGNKTPFEAWGGTDQWTTIEGNLENLPKNKLWRFQPDAMEKFDTESEFLNRALVDTQYLSRIATQYLDALYTKGGHVRVVPGRLTEMLRRHWGLNSLLSDEDKKTVHGKNRTDHRHHAIDAAVVACTDQGLIQRIAKGAERDELDGAEEVARSVDAPWKRFREDLGKVLATTIVSHRPNHGRIDTSAKKDGRDSTAGSLHNSTAYGIVDKNEVVSRSLLSSLKPGDIETTKRGRNIRDPDLQKALQKAALGKEGKQLEATLQKFSRENSTYMGIRRVRMIENLQGPSRVEIAEGDDKPYKVYKGDSNYCLELWKMPDEHDSSKPEYCTEVVTMFEAHSNISKRPHPTAKRILQLFKRDVVAIERDGQTKLYYVQSFTQSGQMWLAEHFQGNAYARNKSKDDSFSFLSLKGTSIVKARMRRVHVDVMGRVRDPGAGHYE